ncbi:hypothetical protein ACS0TY_010497 [Phlomoides rotata]
MSSARLSILINGSPHGYFGCSRGVRQGDPLSPPLFCIAEYVLARLIDRAVLNNEFHSAFFLNRFYYPAYLLYVDDILAFNPDKSRAHFGKHVSAQNKAYFRATLNISSPALSLIYLGVPIFRGAPKAAQLRGTADRIIGKFASWKGSSLSLASRVCLVNSIIISSLVHSMMIYKWPRSLLNKIEKVMRNFIWTGSIEEKGFCMVNWSKVCAPREEDAQNSVHYIFRLEGYS